MGFGHFVRKNRKDWGEKWSFGVVCEEKSGILSGNSGVLVKKSGIWGFCEEKKTGFGGEKWSFGAVCEEKSGILVVKSGIWAICESKK